MSEDHNKEWEWDGDCSRCFSTMTWEGDDPETEEEAICDTCLREVVVELRKENYEIKNKLTKSIVLKNT